MGKNNSKLIKAEDSLPQIKRQYYEKSKDEIKIVVNKLEKCIDLDSSRLNILDIGFGPGHIVEELGKKHNVCGIDIDKDWINFAKMQFHSNNNIQILNANAEFLPFRNECFDLIICNLVFSYFLNENQALFDINRILKVNGVLFLKLHGVGYYIYRLFTNEDMTLVYKTLSLFSGVINQFLNKKLLVSPDTYQVSDKFKIFFRENNIKILDFNYYDPWHGINKFFIIVGKKMK
jgi:ubiquinone/menaquinone biosynthesis C-methylase UbiE